MKAIKFRNWTDEDFSWKFDGNLYNFPANSEIYMEQDRAWHFAKHLTDRELNKAGKSTGVLDSKVPDANRAEFEAKCFPSDEAVSSEVALDLNVKKAKKVVKKDKEFPDLK